MRNADSMLRRDALLVLGSGVLLSLVCRAQDGVSIISVRVWPARDYSRVVIESTAPLHTTQTFVATPPRLAVDIHDIVLDGHLKALLAQVRPDDPFIAGVRVAQYTPQTVRIVLDLKQAIDPQVYLLAPVVGMYQHRLALDLIPLQQPDPLAALVAQFAHSRSSAQADRAGQSMPAGPGAADAAAEDPLGVLIARKQSRTRKEALEASTMPQSPRTDASPQVALPPPSEGVGSPPPTRERVRAPMLGVAEGQRLVLIALDPGHGGEDPGAIGPAGTMEKTVVLRIAQRLQERMNEDAYAATHAAHVGGLRGLAFRAFLTRDADYFVALGERVRKAERAKADLFVSIHADAFTLPTARGASVFALSEKGASSVTARWLARKENASDQIGGIALGRRDVSVARVLLDMGTTAQIRSSLKLGSNVLKTMGQIGSLHKPHVEQASFAVLKSVQIPSILVETAFISNPQEEQRLLTHDYREKIVDALLRGIVTYFALNRPSVRHTS